MKSENPELIIRALPAQSLYLAVTSQGIEGSCELIEAATNEQRQLLLDFDLWNRDTFDEEQLFAWLSLPESSGSLEVLQKILRAIDPKLIGLLIARYVEIIVPEDKSDTPMQDGFTTPDNGQSWIKVTHEDANKSFLISRLLALMFETSAAFYYQLTAIPGVTTQTILEEESFADKNRRLSAEGIPDQEIIELVTAPLTIADLPAIVAERKPISPAQLPPVEPFLTATPTPAVVEEIFNSATEKEYAISEFALLMNTCVMRFLGAYAEFDKITLLTEQVKGALAIGCEIVKQKDPQLLTHVLKEVGLQPLFRIGLTELLNLRKKAVKLKRTFVTSGHPLVLKVIDALAEPFPATILAAISKEASTTEQGDLRVALRSLTDLHVTAAIVNSAEFTDKGDSDQ